MSDPVALADSLEGVIHGAAEPALTDDELDAIGEAIEYLRDDGEKTVIDKVQDLADEFEENSELGAIMVNGLAGYHTLFRRSDGIDYAHETALHIALDEALMEVHVDPDMARDFHGEYTPETAATMLENQLEDFLGVSATSPFAERFVGEYERVLREFQEKLAEEGEEVTA